jgi:hypothetical protein
VTPASLAISEPVTSEPACGAGVSFIQVTVHRVSHTINERLVDDANNVYIHEISVYKTSLRRHFCPGRKRGGPPTPRRSGRTAAYGTRDSAELGRDRAVPVE